MDSILMIGGGQQQVPAVAAAQRMGFRVIVTDRSPNAHAFASADEAVVIDGRDIEALVAWTLLHKETLGIRGVFSLSELVTSVAAVSSAAQLPGAGLAQTVACQNKALCKSRWQSSSIPTPRGGHARSAAEARALLEELDVSLERPAFAKPAVGFGGAGAGRVESIDDAQLIGLFAGAGRERWSPIMIEEQLTGSMHDVNGLFDAEGRFHPMGIVDRFFLDGRPVEIGIQTPSVLSETRQAELYAVLEAGMRALDIEFGPVKGDAVLTSEGFKLLEVAPRLHGPKSSLMALPLSGFEPLRAALRVLTGETPEPEALAIRQIQHVVCRALLPTPRRIHRIEGVEEAEAIEGIERVLLFARPGTRISSYRSSADVPGYVIATGNSLAQCEARLDEAASKIRFIDGNWRRLLPLAPVPEHVGA